MSPFTRNIIQYLGILVIASPPLAFAVFKADDTISRIGAVGAIVALVVLYPLMMYVMKNRYPEQQKAKWGRGPAEGDKK